MKSKWLLSAEGKEQIRAAFIQKSSGKNHLWGEPAFTVLLLGSVRLQLSEG